MTFNFIPRAPERLTGEDCGYFALPAYTVYENTAVLPRAFLVSAAEPLPERAQVFHTLMTTDFRRRVLLEGWSPATHASSSTPLRPATIREYQPNRVVIDVDGEAAGFLVLADVWFPGWRCTVDEESYPIYRANFLFRAVEVPAGTHRVVFTFTPASYYWGRIISSVVAVTLLLLGLIVTGRVVWQYRFHRR
jgi:hypothetical protein